MVDPKREIPEAVDAELRFHFEERVEELVAAGLSPAEAQARASEEFGDVAAVRDGLVEIDRRTFRRRRRRETLLLAGQDLRQAFRRLRRSPGFVLTSVLTLALGIGAVCAVFGTLDAVVLRPLPYADSERLVRLQNDLPGIEDTWALAKGQFVNYRSESESFDAMGLYVLRSVILRTPEGESLFARTAEVSADMADVLSVTPARGRLFRPEESLPGAPSVVVVTDAFWRNHLGGREDVLGSTLDLNGTRYEIVGVLPPSARLPEEIQFGENFVCDLWMPIALDPAAPAQNHHVFRGLARLRDGRPIEAARTELAALTARFPETLPTAYSPRFMNETGFTPELTYLRDEVVGSAAKLLWIVLGAVGVVLLITCANVANLFLVRGEARRREIAVRSVMGAGRADLARHRLSETLLVTGTAAAAGLALAWAGMRLLVRAAPQDLPRLAEIGLTPLTIGFAVMLAIAIGLLFGLVPVGRKGTEGRVLREAGRANTLSRGRRFARSSLIVVQIGLCFALLAGAGLLLRSFALLTSVEPGFDPDGVLVFRVALSPERYADGRSQTQFYRAFSERLALLPGVTSVGAGSAVPLGGVDGCTGVRADAPTGPVEGGKCIPVSYVTPGFFETLGIPVRGRTPTWDDMERSGGNLSDMDGALVPTAGLARDFWGENDPLDQLMHVPSGRDETVPVVGVAADIANAALDQPPVHVLYATAVHSQLAIFVRSTAEDPLALLPPVRRALAELDPGVPIVRPQTMAAIVAASTSRLAFTATLLGLAALMALLIGAVGIYGVISYVTAQRRGEIGIRMALGAHGGQVRRLVLSDTLRVALLGILGGLLLTLAIGRALASFLYGVSASDPLTLVAVAAILAGIAGLAGWLPARRAVRIDPLTALRE